MFEPFGANPPHFGSESDFPDTNGCENYQNKVCGF